MNCKNVEELLPLYAGRDIDEDAARLVNSHLQVCSECASSALDYGETHRLLQMFETPKFSEETYTAVRSKVLREIQRTPRATGLMAFFLRPSLQPVTWAVSAAIVVVVCLVAYYSLTDRMSQPEYHRQLANDNAGNQHTPPKQATAPDEKDRLAMRPDPTEAADVSPAPLTGSHRPRFNRRLVHSMGAGGTPAVPVRVAPYSPRGESKDGSLNTSATADRTMRLEIQTSDPNIRIIWFSNPSNNQGSPSESSKGI